MESRSVNRSRRRPVSDGVAAPWTWPRSVPELLQAELQFRVDPEIAAQAMRNALRRARPRIISRNSGTFCWRRHIPALRPSSSAGIQGNHDSPATDSFQGTGERIRRPMPMLSKTIRQRVTFRPVSRKGMTLSDQNFGPCAINLTYQHPFLASQVTSSRCRRGSLGPVWSQPDWLPKLISSNLAECFVRLP